SLGLSTSLTFNTSSIPSAQTIAPLVLGTADFNDDGKLDILGISAEIELFLNTTPTGSTTPTFNSSAYINDDYDLVNVITSSLVTAHSKADAMPDCAVPSANEVVASLNETAAGSSTLSFATYTLSFENLMWGPLAAVALNGPNQLLDIVAVGRSGQSMT